MEVGFQYLHACGVGRRSALSVAEHERSRVSSMHSVQQRETPEVLAHSSDGPSVPGPERTTSGHAPRRLKVQQLHRLLARRCCSR